ncbi:dicarboxylate/amino acid:cation symporter [Candidatus Sumerlaeota bacterium]|nr:dicarboxylate/amino acid:cation symporter [Candidatus Sumerlaeota bacterium]
MRLSLTNAILLGIALAIALGLLANFASTEGPDPDHPGQMKTLYPLWAALLIPLSELMGQVFLQGIKMLVAPLILTAIVAGIATIPTRFGIARLGIKTLIYYLVTTTLAVILGLVCVNMIRPGEGKTVDSIREELGAAFDIASARLVAIETEGKIPEGAGDLIRNLINQCLTNPFEALAEPNVLGIITFSILMGLLLPHIGPRGKPLIELFQAGFDLMIRIVHVFLWLVPFGAFGLLYVLLAEVGLRLFVPLGAYCATVIVGIGLHGLITLPLILILVGRFNPWRFFKGYREALAVAFTTTSSSATLPVSMKCAEKNLGVPNHTASFVLPLGSTVNMDGTALYEAVAVMFFAQLYGMEMTLYQQVLIAITATVAAIGAAGIPSAGLVTMFIVCAAVGVDPAAIALIIPVDHMLDMFRTATNVAGDGVGAVVIARTDGEDLEANVRKQAESPSSS